MMLSEKNLPLPLSLLLLVLLSGVGVELPSDHQCVSVVRWDALPDETRTPELSTVNLLGPRLSVYTYEAVGRTGLPASLPLHLLLLAVLYLTTVRILLVDRIRGIGILMYRALSLWGR